MRVVFAPPDFPSHSHVFLIVTSESEGHTHVMDGFTKPVNGNAFDGHFHFFSGISSFDEGHYHRFYGKTGPAIPLPDGTHYHSMSGRTYFNYNKPPGMTTGGVQYAEGGIERHFHLFDGMTGNPVGVDQPAWYRWNPLWP
ncbi:YmaF family protein [Bacillus sp. SJS]|uniref:YmaF family protein n=1 Tax=Bacillus sp. SJS TaxID=1423321 RepID=UPI00068D2440|nr:YmaF family protein [Bacillus sp. SJS]KZZ82761.1 hypothetical protein AS29_018315 [Bacillus sp. SJS]